MQIADLLTGEMPHTAKMLTAALQDIEKAVNNGGET
jgi:hypothetical protein